MKKVKRGGIFAILILLSASSALSQHNIPPKLAGEGYFPAADGVRLFYRTAGKGKKVVVLLHGGPGSSMNGVFPDLEPLAKNYTVLMYDQRGGGRSELIKDPNLLTAAHHVRDLEA